VKDVQIYLKGWHDSSLYADAANDAGHELHAEAMAMHGRSFQPYEPGDVMHLAFEYRDDAPDAEDMVVCERAFRWFNVEDNNPIVRKYRAAGNRSLSVGDVVVIEGRAYGCGRFGWDAIEDFKPTLTER
jgi:hypothetical protein